ncbi:MULTISPECIES: hypothetical protein [Sphingobium]|nr:MULTISPECIES: hypothetical protein [Sphingobium]
MVKVNWTKAKKTVPVERHHRVHCAAVSSSFVAPSIASKVEFDRYQLLLSIGRNLAMGTASRELIKALAAGRSPLLKHLVDNTTSPLRLSTEVADIGDTPLTNLSHDIGVGVSGLYMEAMGYTWRANGKEVFAFGDRIPDYVWDTATPGGGVVLSEAKGATSVKSDFNAVDARARDGMFGQVMPRIGDYVGAEQILAGYAFGVCATGGMDARTAVYEAMDFTGGIATPPTLPAGTPSVEILRSHFAGVMRLLGLADGQIVENLLEGQLSFAVYGDDRQQFVVPETGPHGPVRRVTFDTVTITALSMKVAARALDLLLFTGDDPDQGRVPWPRFPFMWDALPRGVLAVAPDGLALVSRFGRSWPNVRWFPKKGFVQDDR